MLRHAKGFVSALLPIVPLILCPACGGGASDDVPTASNPPASAPISEPPASNGNAGNANGAPTIAATPDGYARVGETYELLPSATDPDGDSLMYTAENLPPWASIDPSSGRITGTPGEFDVGVYEAIRIRVADGSRTTVSPPFTITVTGTMGTGHASLRWELPAAKVDGSPLDDLAGFRILFGRSAEDLDQSVLIDDPSVTSYEFTDLPAGVWYFAVVAVNAGGLEGPPTITTMKSI